MRIISGKFRGRTLRSPRGLGVRPTSSRLRESLFNILGPGIAGSVFLDGFAGTGAVGLEAISRGAREVVFIESSKECCGLIHENLKRCAVSSGYRILRQDAFAALRALGREGFSADIIFLDPPYQWNSHRALLEIIFQGGLTHTAAKVVVEHHRKADLPGEATDCRRARVVRQSDKCLSFYVREATPRVESG